MKASILGEDAARAWPGWLLEPSPLRVHGRRIIESANDRSPRGGEDAGLGNRRAGSAPDEQRAAKMRGRNVMFE